MTQPTSKSGYFRCGLPYTRAGRGPRPLVVFPGLTFENKPQFGMLSMYGFLREAYTLFAGQHRPGMPAGYSHRDMRNDHATMIREEFGGPVDVIGISTGGSIALHFAADHPELVRKLVIHSSAHTLNEGAKALQLDVARLAQPLVWPSASLLSLKPPHDPGDLVATVEAEDKHAFKGRLHEIAAPTMVAGGADDFFYSATLFREAAAGVPGARLRLYEDVGHPAGGKRFRSDVLAFLRENGEGSGQ